MLNLVDKLQYLDRNLLAQDDLVETAGWDCFSHEWLKRFRKHARPSAKETGLIGPFLLYGTGGTRALVLAMSFFDQRSQRVAGRRRASVVRLQPMYGGMLGHNASFAERPRSRISAHHEPLCNNIIND